MYKLGLCNEGRGEKRKALNREKRKLASRFAEKKEKGKKCNCCINVYLMGAST